MLISIAQLIVSIALIILILLQERGAGAGGIFGGGEGEFYHARRGFERLIFASTIILAVIFAGLSILNLVI
ncbi:preprotein translocase subunit SecG [Candidatus Wolfebacteria bacterium]|nr:preprotein translocase subunit SecG [Candidatus Wolfebacteria bacterium]